MSIKLDNRWCPVCGKQLLVTNKSGFCNLHRDRTGANNSFYGKTHSKEVLDLLKEKCKVASAKKWEDEEYRNKVIQSNIGKKRSEEFKQGQRERALKQFEDKEQRKMRSEKMKQTWQEGKIAGEIHCHVNKSKNELELMEELKKRLGDNVTTSKSIKYEEDGKKKWFFPDGIVFGRVVIEFNGNYWHRDPKMYEANEENKAIWEHDQKRYERLNKLGYSVVLVWEDDYNKNKKKIIEDLVNLLEFDNLDFGVMEI